jgi:hypothetical protein
MKYDGLKHFSFYYNSLRTSVLDHMNGRIINVPKFVRWYFHLSILQTLIFMNINERVSLCNVSISQTFGNLIWNVCEFDFICISFCQWRDQMRQLDNISARHFSCDVKTAGVGVSGQRPDTIASSRLILLAGQQHDRFGNLLHRTANDLAVTGRSHTFPSVWQAVTHRTAAMTLLYHLCFKTIIPTEQ